MAGGETWKIGYYGKFNRVLAVMEQIPDVRIVDTWQHHDVTLEDFGFTLVSASGQSTKVNFLEGSPQMKLTKGAEIEGYVRASLRRAH